MVFISSFFSLSLGFFLPLFIPYASPLSLSYHPFPRHSFPPSRLSFAGSHLSPSSLPSAAWPPPHSLHPPVAVVLMAFMSGVFRIYPSHAFLLLYPYPSFASDFRMSLHPFPLVNSGIHEALRLLSLVVSGISEGWLHGLPWQVLPLTRTVVKERLVLEAISPCSCSSFSVAWVANFNSGISASYKRG